ncbi:MAG: 4Fe-4S binding protein, partial [Clostridia bacterium]|nr:4Fe-4S binding protein [Clostridia bacterium]
MGVEYLTPEFEVLRNENRCIACGACVRQCANEVHAFLEGTEKILSDDAKCVDCQRCVSLCPTHALKIVKSDCRLRENA